MLNLFFPKIAHASVDSFVAKLGDLIINPLIILLFALAVAIFLFGVFEFIANQQNEEKKTKGKSHMIWGIIGITIMMGVWFIMNLILDTFNIKGINPQAEVKDSVKLNDYAPDYPDVTL